jgi:hypothetical protein
MDFGDVEWIRFRIQDPLFPLGSEAHTCSNMPYMKHRYQLLPVRGGSTRSFALSHWIPNSLNQANTDFWDELLFCGGRVIFDLTILTFSYINFGQVFAMENKRNSVLLKYREVRRITRSTKNYEKYEKYGEVREVQKNISIEVRLFPLGYLS